MTIFINEDFNIQVLFNAALAKVVSVETEISDGEVGSELPGDFPGADAAVKDPLLSSWPFVIGITAVTLAVSVLCGILLAKRKIKKGYELYED